MADPVYRVLLRDSNDVLHTCVVSGPRRGMVWLYVHAPAPTVLRLHREVVGFLRPALTVLADPEAGNGPWFWTLHRSDLYPTCVVTGWGRQVWLHVFAQSPTAVRLTRPVVAFLADALADLPVCDPPPAVERTTMSFMERMAVAVAGPVGAG